jgi:hypothetical protein
MRKAELLELADSVGFKEYIIPATWKTTIKTNGA